MPRHAVNDRVSGSEDERANERRAKRTRQACEPCRRKKSKCSGERPVCYACLRRNTPCLYVLEPLPPPRRVYQPSGATADALRGPHHRQDEVNEISWTNSDPSPDMVPVGWKHRIESLESTLAGLVNTLKDGQAASLPSPNQLSQSSRLQPHDARHRASAHTATLAPNPATGSQNLSPGNSDASDSSPAVSIITSWSTAVALAEVYFVFCDGQPLPLFDGDSFVATFPNRPMEVVYAVVAVACTFSDRLPQRIPPDSMPDRKRCKDEARSLALNSLSNRSVELSTLQTLCLLALMDFHDGDMLQYRTHSYLAMSIARSAQFNREPRSSADDVQNRGQESLRCYWSVILLHRLMGEESLAFGSPDFRQHPAPLPLPRSRARPSRLASSPAMDSLAQSPSVQEDHGIMSVVIHLSGIWHQVQEFVRGCGSRIPDTSSAGKALPWQDSSMYNRILTNLMDLSQTLPSIHRYRSMPFSSMTPDDINECRDYWGPWLLSRLLYHTAMCLLNHPVLLMLQIQGIKNIPEIFLHQTVSARLHHASWLLHFLKAVESKKFYTSDPIFGYCAATLATIEIHQGLVDSGAENAGVRNDNYQRCVQYLTHLGSKWPYMLIKVRELHDLKSITSASYQSTTSGRDGASVNIDVSRFIKIILVSDFFSAGDPSTFLGPSLSSHLSQPDRPGRSDLPQLPQITRHGDETTLNSRGQSRKTIPEDNVNATGGQTCNLSSSNDMNHYQFGNELLLPSTQFWGDVYGSASPWSIGATGLPDDIPPPTAF